MLDVLFDRLAEPDAPAADCSNRKTSVRVYSGVYWHVIMVIIPWAIFLVRLDFLLDEAEAEFVESCILVGGGGSEALRRQTLASEIGQTTREF